MTNSLHTLRLKPKRHFPFLARHPWVHAHALADSGVDLPVGSTVDLVDHDGNFMGRGLVNPNSKLRIRLYTFDAQTELDEAFFCRRLDSALRRRDLILPANPDDGRRLVFSESDLISGLIVDRYAGSLSVQWTAAGIRRRFGDALLRHLVDRVGAESVMVRVDEKTARLEGDEPLSAWHTGFHTGPITYQENGLTLSVDLEAGQKTGGYLDQRFNHAVAAELAVGKRVLDVCCYHGGFGLVAAKRGAASVMAIDSSAAALQHADATAKANGLAEIDFVQGDCFDVLEDLGRGGEKFDTVILDPPRFAGSRHQVDTALRAYHRLNSYAVSLLPPGGTLVTCSCSGRISEVDFLEMLAKVSRRARQDLVVVETRGAAPDHPVAVSCPEARYLKCVILNIGLD
ncbi:MAG: class I SAM-dependent rRNA methyltransferase [Planctomycetota bacterium]